MEGSLTESVGGDDALKAKQQVNELLGCQEPKTRTTGSHPTKLGNRSKLDHTHTSGFGRVLDTRDDIPGTSLHTQQLTQKNLRKAQ